MASFSQAEIEQSLVERFARVVARAPRAIALVDAEHRHTYGEVAGATRAVAGAILASGTEAGGPVAVLGDHDAATVIAIFGVLAAGRAYVPLDRAQPTATLAHMLENSGAGLLLVSGAGREVANALAPRLPVVDIAEALAHPPADALEKLAARSTADSPACLLYTSGSTGVPKGILHTHRTVGHLVWSNGQAYGLGPSDRLVLAFSPSYAASLSEIFGALLHGASLALVNGKGVGMGELAARLRRERISVLKLPVGLFRTFLRSLSADERFPDIRLVQLGGEALFRKDVEQFRSHFRDDCRLVNRLASTESLSTTRYPIDRDLPLDEGVVPVGQACEDIEVSILDDAGRPLPAGEVGQIAVRSRYLSPGYWRNPELTLATFLPGSPADPRATLLTGDLGRLRPDGCLEHFGRRDQQVKVRGFRIELPVVEAALAALDDVKEAAALAQATATDGETLRLVGYLVPYPGRTLRLSAIRRALGRALPDFMVPSLFVVLGSLPTTPTGKVDRRRLPSPASVPILADGARVAPRSTIERQLVEVWREVLGVGEVGVRDNFFDLGGDSLLLLRAHARVCALLDVALPTVVMFGHPTIAALADYLAGHLAGAQSTSNARPPSSRSAEAPIAVVGMAGVFPGARDVAELWRNLRAGVESVRTLTDGDLAAAGATPEWIAHPATVKTMPELPEWQRYDAEFFGLAPREAALLDPQHRLLLEVAWHALEHAGHVPGTYAGRIGIFAGCLPSLYAQERLAAQKLLPDGPSDLEVRLATEPEFLVTRIAYKLDLRGPAVNVSTACSTALVAVHLACRSLVDGECEMALAGGAAFEHLAAIGYRHQPGWITSRDGHCRAFAADAQGTVLGNGAGLVVLKRLDRARADRDTIHAVIRGSAVNNDGAAKVGFAAPSVAGQAEVIAAAQAAAGVTGDTIDYVEAHGTGTALGDPIEIAALTQVFRARTARQGFCALGSVKTNVGHLSRAAGIAGLIKTVLALRHREMPPSLHCERPSPAIDWSASPFFVNRELRPWPAVAGRPRRGAVSSFGVGGTNAHLILDEAPAPAGAQAGPTWQLLPLSARTTTALAASARHLAQRLADNALDLADVAFTLQTGRHAFARRRFVVARDCADAIEKLGGAAALPAAEHTPAGPADRPVIFLFPGQGAQYVGMGRGLYNSLPSFRADIDRCAEILTPELGLDLRETLFASADQAAPAAARLAETRFTQPALLTIAWALARMLMRLGVQPSALIGHSIGEHAAACIAGVWDIEPTLRMVARRGRLIQSLPPGRMVVVHLPEAEAARLCDGEVALAAVNAPALCVLAGPENAVHRLTERLDQRGIDHHLLRTSHAFHSQMMDPALPDFTAEMARHPARPPQIPYVSGVTGDWMRPEDAAAPDYFSRLLRGTVRFSEGLRTLASRGPAVLLEVGPGKSLVTLAKMHSQLATFPALNCLRAPTEALTDREVFLQALGDLWVQGARPEWSLLHEGEDVRRVPLPGYPFDRREHWISTAGPLAVASAGPTAAPSATPVHAVAPRPRDALLATPSSARPDSVRRYLEGAIHRLLGAPSSPPHPLDTNRPLGELGVDSLQSIRLQALIAADLDVELGVRALIAESIATLAARIVEALVAGRAGEP
jgi:amino acid adenylation domain-containing protein